MNFQSGILHSYENTDAEHGRAFSQRLGRVIRAGRRGWSAAGRTSSRSRRRSWRKTGVVTAMAVALLTASVLGRLMQWRSCRWFRVIWRMLDYSSFPSAIIV